MALLGEIPGTADELREAESMASLPMRMGGLGLRSAGRCAAAAYWASWADALPMISQRNPNVADLVEERMSGEGPPEGFLANSVSVCSTVGSRGILVETKLVSTPERCQAR